MEQQQTGNGEKRVNYNNEAVNGGDFFVLPQKLRGVRSVKGKKGRRATMKIVARPIDAVVLFTGKDTPRPYRFRYKEEGGDENEQVTVKIDRIFQTEKTNIAGAPAYVYRCQSELNGTMKLYELRYFIKECRWELYKI